MFSETYWVIFEVIKHLEQAMCRCCKIFCNEYHQEQVKSMPPEHGYTSFMWLELYPEALKLESRRFLSFHEHLKLWFSVKELKGHTVEKRDIKSFRHINHLNTLPAPTINILGSQLVRQCRRDLERTLKLRKATTHPSLASPNHTWMKSGSLPISRATVSPFFRVPWWRKTCATLLLRLSTSRYESTFPS